MERIPTEVRDRLERARGARVDLWVDPGASGGVRVLVVLVLEAEPPLGITIDRLFEAEWPLGGAPALRILWRMQSVVRAVRLSIVQSFVLPGSDPAVRVEVELEGAATLVFEGAALQLGPVPPPSGPPIEVSALEGFEA
jgi:hypothetical protein